MFVSIRVFPPRTTDQLRGSELALLRMRWRLQLPAPLADDGLAQREALGGASAFGLRGMVPLKSSKSLGVCQDFDGHGQTNASGF